MNFSKLLFPDARLHEEIYELLYKRYHQLFYWQIVKRFQLYDHLDEGDIIQLFRVARKKLQIVDELFPAEEFTSLKKAEISFRYYLRHLIGREMDYYISTRTKTISHLIRESCTNAAYRSEYLMIQKQTEDLLKSLVPRVDYECYKLVHSFHMSEQEIAHFIHIPVSLVRARLNRVSQAFACAWLHNLQDKEHL